MAARSASSPWASCVPRPPNPPPSGCSTSRPSSTPGSTGSSPTPIAVEQVFADVNVASVMHTMQASAIPLLAAARAGLPVELHTPTSVKAAVTGSGRADKAQVTAMVTRILRMESAPKPADAADALAIAICHLWQGAATTGSRTPPAPSRRRLARCRPGARWPGDRLGPRPGAPRRSRPGGRRGRGSRHAAAHHPGHRLRPAPRPGGAARHHAGGARGLADPLRLRAPTTSATSSSRCRPSPASVRGSPWRCSRCWPPTACAPPSTSADLATLTKVPGIGKKGAERIVLELRDKLGMPSGAAGAATAVPAVGATAWRDQVAEALVGLGYSAKQADDAVSTRRRGRARRCRRLGDAPRRPARAGALGHGRRLLLRDVRGLARSMPPPGSSTPTATPTSAPSRRPCVRGG